MKLEIIGHGDYYVDEKMKNLITKKLSRLDKYFGPGAAGRLVLSQEGSVCKMDITINGAPGTAVRDRAVRAEASSPNMYDNIDILVPRVTRQFRREQTKHIAERHEKVKSEE